MYKNRYLSLRYACRQAFGYWVGNSSLSWSDLVSAGIAYCSLAQSPKSMSLQRLLQKGRYGLSGENSANCLQFGHATERFLEAVMAMIIYNVILKGTEQPIDYIM